MLPGNTRPLSLYSPVASFIPTFSICKTRMRAQRPSRREEFEVGILCALPLEYDAVSLVFDQYWDDDGDHYGKVPGDHNVYTTGRIGKHNVVLALLSHMGKTKATSAAQGMRLSYPSLRLTLLVGICGAVPFTGDAEVLLGDVVISKNVVQYDFGRQYGESFQRKDTVGHGIPDKEVQNLLATLGTMRGIDLLHRRTAFYLEELQLRADASTGSEGRYDYPGTAEDRLFSSSYEHRLRMRGQSTYTNAAEAVHTEATYLSCEEAGCDTTHLIPRKRLEQTQLKKDRVPAVYIGSIASADRVMKSAEIRDRIAKAEGVIAFEMELAGAWEELPCTVVVKGACDYADSHKNKKWQPFAAATAAAAMKAMLERFIVQDKAPRHIDAAILSVVSQFSQRLPPQMMSPEHVTVIDARNRYIRFFLDTITSWELFAQVLNERFKDLGLGKIQRGEWYLQDHYTGKALDITRPWGALMRPGQVLSMTMIFRRRNVSFTHCPGCHSDNSGDSSTQVTCATCGLIYRRIEEVHEIGIVESSPHAHRVPAIPHEKHVQNVPAVFPRPRSLSNYRGDDDIGQYSRVQIIETSFKFHEIKNNTQRAGIQSLSLSDINDLESLAAYLAEVHGLPEQDCEMALRDCGPQFLALTRAQETPTGHANWRQQFESQMPVARQVRKQNTTTARPPKMYLDRHQAPIQGVDRSHILAQSSTSAVPINIVQKLTSALSIRRYHNVSKSESGTSIPASQSRSEGLVSAGDLAGLDDDSRFEWNAGLLEIRDQLAFIKRYRGSRNQGMSSLSLVEAATPMAGIVAGSVAGWSAVDRVVEEADED
ncbi:hypothetical protein BDW74DRAFT_160559 [Aspergillus multicolor]|uniref:uncharacterized protein n=1 Tax=Aspergillus multicolor TaxID=41759 RepID=UPI003CCD0E31